LVLLGFQDTRLLQFIDFVALSRKFIEVFEPGCHKGKGAAAGGPFWVLSPYFYSTELVELTCMVGEEICWNRVGFSRFGPSRLQVESSGCPVVDGGFREWTGVRIF